MRYLTKKHLSRRTLLRGAGAAVALPLLESMLPAGMRSAYAAGAPRTRFACVYIPHGCVMNRWVPSAAGRDFELPPILKSLEPYRERLNIVSGLRLASAYVGESSAAANHGRSSQCWLTLHAGGLRAVADVGRPARRAPYRPANAAAVAGARARGRLVDLVSDAANAVADGDEPARGVRAPVRRRQHGRGAGHAAAAAIELARLRHRPGGGARARVCRPPTASAWTAI